MVSKRDFTRAYEQGVRVRGSVLALVMVANGLERSRLGLSIGKSIWKSAVKRNRVRRVFREAFRLTQHELPQGFDLIAIAGQPKLEPELDATCREWIALARKGAARWNQSTPEERAAQRARAAEQRAAKRAAKPAKSTGGRRAPASPPPRTKGADA